MNVAALFHAHRDEAVRLWTEAVYATYPFETPGFLRTRHDPFGNPAAQMTKEAACMLFDAAAGNDVDMDAIKAALDRFVKLRAVQQHTPGQSLGIFYLMKPVMRRLIMPRMAAEGLMDAYLEAESRVDSLAMLAFDIYSAARETLAQSRIDEIRNQHAQLTRWAQTIQGSPVFTGKR